MSKCDDENEMNINNSKYSAKAKVIWKNLHYSIRSGWFNLGNMKVSVVQKYKSTCEPSEDITWHFSEPYAPGVRNNHLDSFLLNYYWRKKMKRIHFCKVHQDWCFQNLNIWCIHSLHQMWIWILKGSKAIPNQAEKRVRQNLSYKRDGMEIGPVPVRINWNSQTPE